MIKRKLTPEEELEIQIVELAYELQLDDCDAEDYEEFGMPDSPLKAEYYEMAKKIIEEERK